jgi:hypothetical protein
VESDAKRVPSTLQLMQHFIWLLTVQRRHPARFRVLLLAQQKARKKAAAQNGLTLTAIWVSFSNFN